MLRVCRLFGLVYGKATLAVMSNFVRKFEGYFKAPQSMTIK